MKTPMLKDLKPRECESAEVTGGAYATGARVHVPTELRVVRKTRFSLRLQEGLAGEINPTPSP